MCKTTKYFLLTKKRDNLRLAGWLSVISVLGIVPLLFIWPIGYRCLFHSSVILIGAVLLAADETLMELRPEKKRIIITAVLSSLVVAVICEGMIISDIRRMVSVRNTYVEEQAKLGADSAAIFLIPSPYIYEGWNEDTEHYHTVEGHQIRLKILPADVWFRTYYYHYR